MKEKHTNDIVVEAELPISVEEIAYELGQPASFDAVFQLLTTAPEIVEKNIQRTAETYIQEQKARVRVRSIRLEYVDSKSRALAVAYFKAELTGIPEEFAKVIGEEKLFQSQEYPTLAQ